VTEDRQIEDKLKTFLLQEYLDAESTDSLTDQTPLITSGTLDSVGTWAVVAFMEEQFAISVRAHEADVENLDTISDMARFVRNKQTDGS